MTDVTVKEFIPMLGDDMSKPIMQDGRNTQVKFGSDFIAIDVCYPHVGKIMTVGDFIEQVVGKDDVIMAEASYSSYEPMYRDYWGEVLEYRVELFSAL